MMIHALGELGVHSMASPALDDDNGGVDQLEFLRQTIERAAHLLPAQGPITVFIE